MHNIGKFSFVSPIVSRTSPTRPAPKQTELRNIVVIPVESRLKRLFYSTRASQVPLSLEVWVRRSLGRKIDLDVTVRKRVLTLRVRPVWVQRYIMGGSVYRFKGNFCYLCIRYPTCWPPQNLSRKIKVVLYLWVKGTYSYFVLSSIRHLQITFRDLRDGVKNHGRKRKKPINNLEPTYSKKQVGTVKDW